VAKWEKDHPVLKFLDFAHTFDASHQGNISQSELLKMLTKMKSASKLTEKDLNLIWNNCEQYQANGSTKINIEEMLTVMGSYELKNIQSNGDTFGQEEEMEKLRSGKKRLSTFAASLSKPAGFSHGGHDMGFGGTLNEHPSNSGGKGGRKGSLYGKEKPKAGGGMAKLMGKSGGGSKKHQQHGRTEANTDRPLWPAERAREKRNSMLRTKLKEGREVMRKEEEQYRIDHLTQEQRVHERIEAERREAEQEAAARIVEEREAIAHAAAAARVAERNIEVAARRDRLEHQTQSNPLQPAQDSQYEKWSRFYEDDGGML